MNTEMEAAANALADVLNSEYVSWACEMDPEPVAVVNVAEWLAAHPPPEPGAQGRSR